MKPSQLNRILKAESNLTLETIARIFHAFNCRPTIREGTQLVEAVGTEKVSIRQTVLYQTAKVRSART